MYCEEQLNIMMSNKISPELIAIMFGQIYI